MEFVKGCLGRIVWIAPQIAEIVVVHVVSKTLPKGVTTWIQLFVFVKTIRSVVKRMPGAVLVLNWQKPAVLAMENVARKVRLPVVPIRL